MSVIYVNGIKTSCIALPMEEKKTTLANWDFKTSLVDSVHGNTITFVGSGISRSDQYGLVFAGSTSANAQAQIPLGLLQLDTIYELKMGTCDPKFASDNHGRIFSFRRNGDTGNTNHGLAYRHQTGVWSIWDADNLWQDSTITDKDFFSNCLLTIRIGADNNWYIYKDNEFVFKTTTPMATGIVPNIFCLGANNQSFYDMNIESLKIYKVKYSQGGGGTDISEMVRLTESEWSALTEKDMSKIYLVTNDHKDMVRKQFQGDRRILREQNPENYDVYYEDLYFPGDLDTSSGSYVSADQYAFDTDVYPFSSENSSRSFEVTFNVEPHLSQNYGNILALHTYQSGYVGQIYVHKIENNNYGFGIALKSSSDVYRHSSDITNKDVRIVVDKTNLEVKCYVDDVLVNTSSFTNFTYDSPFRIGFYGGYSPFNGKINYVSFKWLD